VPLMQPLMPTHQRMKFSEDIRHDAKNLTVALGPTPMNSRQSLLPKSSLALKVCLAARPSITSKQLAYGAVLSSLWQCPPYLLRRAPGISGNTGTGSTGRAHTCSLDGQGRSSAALGPIRVEIVVVVVSAAAGGKCEGVSCRGRSDGAAIREHANLGRAVAVLHCLKSPLLPHSRLQSVGNCARCRILHLPILDAFRQAACMQTANIINSFLG
jgi:hypothetical protein